MWPKTEVTELLHISYPIIQAPMAGGVTTPELVAAVSANGGLGSFGAGYLKPEQIRHAIHEIRKYTNQPFAINLFIPEPITTMESSVEKMTEYLSSLPIHSSQSAPSTIHPNFKEQVEVVIEEKVPVLSFTFGLLEEEIIQRLKQEAIVTIGTATTVQEAILLEQSGVDMVVAQGSEAGGHRGTFAGDHQHSLISNMVLLPTIADKLSIPLIAAGGIMDARGMLASFVLGASAVQMGTAFIPTKESGAHPLFKETLLNSTETDTIVTKNVTGKPVRAIKNELVQSLEEYAGTVPDYPIQHMLTQGIRQSATLQDNPAWMSMWSGQGTRLCKELDVETLMKELIKDMNKLIANF